MDESWTCAEEVPQTFIHDDLEAWLDWHGKEKDLKRPQDDLDELDHEVLYLQDYPRKMPELKSSVDLEGSVYDRLGPPQPLLWSVQTWRLPMKCLA